MNISEWLFFNGLELVTIIGGGIALFMFRRSIQHDSNKRKKDIRGLRQEINILITALAQFIGRYTDPKDTSMTSAPINIMAQIATIRTANSRSPFALTNKGLEVARKIDAQTLVDKYIERVHSIISNDAHKLSIQEICFNYARNQFLGIVEAKERQIIWDAIYEEGGNADEVLVIYGVLFRNSIFEKRNIPVPKNGGSETTHP